MNILEALGFFTGLICVIFVLKRNIWNFLWGILSSVFFAVLFFQSRLYWDMLLQFVMIVLSALGWYWWAQRERAGETAAPELPVIRATPQTLFISSALIIAATPIMMKLSHAVGGAAPFWDSLTTALSLVAQVLLGRKMIENWWFWIIADLIYIPLYCSRDLYLTGALYIVFLGLCLAGLREWKRELSTETPDAAYATT